MLDHLLYSLVFVLLLQDNTAKGKTGTLSSKKQQSASAGDEVANDRDTSKEEQESAEYISAGRNVGTTVSDEGSDGKDDIKVHEKAYMMAAIHSIYYYFSVQLNEIQLYLFSNVG